MFENVLAFHRPRSIPEAVQLLLEGGSQARFVSGGTDLISQGDRSIRYLVDLTHAGLHYIHIESDALVIGATTKLAELLESPAIRAFAGGILAQAAAGIGSVQLRNMATVGGKVITGGLAADILTPLAALDATAVVETDGARRRVSFAAGSGELREACFDGGLLVEIRVPIPRNGMTWSFQRFGRVDSGIALATASAGIELATDGNVAAASIAVDGKRIPAPKAGGKPDEAWIAQAAEQAALEADTVSDFRASAEYRRHLIGVLTQRALRDCAAQARQTL